MEAVRWLVGDQPLRVLDLGAGTGKLTRTLVDLGHDLVAVEPSAEMLAELRRVLPEVEALTGSAEEIPLRHGSVDAVACGQAFHWFDPVQALPELARVLVPRGRLGLAWNRFDEDQELAARLDRALPASRNDPPHSIEALERSELFDTIESQSFPFARELGRSDFVECIGTASAVATLPGVERMETLAAVGSLHDDMATQGVVSVPYVTFAYRTRRI